MALFSFFLICKNRALFHHVYLKCFFHHQRMSEIYYNWIIQFIFVTFYSRLLASQNVYSFVKEAILGVSPVIYSRPNRVGVSHPHLWIEKDQVSEMLNFFFVFLEYQTMDKSKTSVILSLATLLSHKALVWDENIWRSFKNISLYFIKWYKSHTPHLLFHQDAFIQIKKFQYSNDAGWQHVSKMFLWAEDIEDLFITESFTSKRWFCFLLPHWGLQKSWKMYSFPQAAIFTLFYNTWILGTYVWWCFKNASIYLINSFIEFMPPNSIISSGYS
jgi:hypothetical protein